MSGFYMPVRVYEETGAVRKHAAELAAYGRKALLVTGRRSAFENGSAKDVCDALDAQGTAYAVYAEVEENPSIETIMKARDFGLREGVDFVIGIGGGSPLDAAKAIALMLRHPEKDYSYLYSPDGDSAALPIVAVPTTCGTGSEVTAVSVLTNTSKLKKGSIPHKLFPQLALIDGAYLKAAPASVIANTSFDALTHLYESYLNTKATPWSRMCVDAGLKTWARTLPVLRGEREATDADRTAFMRSSALAGMAIAQTATSLPHGLSYPLTMHLGVPHGKATAYFTAGYLAAAPEADRTYLLKTAGFRNLEDFRHVYHNSCGGLTADPQNLRDVLDAAVAEISRNPVKLQAAPFSVDQAILRQIAFYESEA